MSKVTSKLQVTIPKEIARKHGIKPGSRIRFDSAGDLIRVVKEGPDQKPAEAAEEGEKSLGWFDQATARQKARNGRVKKRLRNTGSARGWSREDLYRQRISR